MIEREFGIEIEDRFEVGQGQARARICIEMGAQFRQIRGGHGEADGVRVSAEAGEQRGARFQRVQQVKCANGSARAVRFFAVARDHQRRTAITFDHARGGNSDHSAMPAVAVDDQAERIAAALALLEARVDRFEDPAFFCLALAVELVEFVGDLTGACWHLFTLKSSITSRATSMRPAALMRGAMRNATSPDVSGRPPTCATSSNALSPGFTAERSASSPSLAKTRFSPVKGTASATVAIATIFMKDFSSGSLIAVSEPPLHQRLRQFESDSCAAESLAGILAARLIGIQHGQRRAACRLARAGDDR